MNFPKLNEELIDSNLAMRLFFAVLSVAIIMMSFDSFAEDTKDPVGDALCNVINIFSGGTAKGIAVVGIIALGIQTLRGKLQWEVALVVVAAIIILFKAPDIVQLVSGDSTTACTGTGTGGTGGT